MTKKITGITDLRNSLITLYEKGVCGNIDHKELNAVTNTASKIINTTKVQLKYQAHMETKQDIPFLSEKKK